MPTAGGLERKKKAKMRNAEISEKFPSLHGYNSGDLEELKFLVYDEMQFHPREELEARIKECKNEIKIVRGIRDPQARQAHLKVAEELLAAYKRARRGNPPPSGRTVWKGTRAEAAREIRKRVEKRKHRFWKDLRWASNAFCATHDFPGDPGMTGDSLYVALKDTRTKRKRTTKPGNERLVEYSYDPGPMGR
jgi:hypothetical protein